MDIFYAVKLLNIQQYYKYLYHLYLNQLIKYFFHCDYSSQINCNFDNEYLQNKSFEIDKISFLR